MTPELEKLMSEALKEAIIALPNVDPRRIAEMKRRRPVWNPVLRPEIAKKLKEKVA